MKNHPAVTKVVKSLLGLLPNLNNLTYADLVLDIFASLLGLENVLGE